MNMAKEQAKRAGFVALVGRSNTGKSTLLNALVGTKIAITTPKPQTTRQAIHGVLHAPEGQIVFVDTPGIFEKKGDVLTSKLNRAAKESLNGIDLALYVVDPTRAIGAEEERTMKMVKAAGAKTLLVINKIDERPRYIEDYRALASDFDGVVEVSALKGTHLKTLVAETLARLPEGEALYPEHQITNVDNRFWYAELIREKIFLKLHQEVPYTVGVEVDEIAMRPSKGGKETLYVRARILTDNDQHKRMLIGAGGRMIKTIGTMVRKELEAIHGAKAFIELDVAVDPHWTERVD